MEIIKIQNCLNCPFHYDDADEGDKCYWDVEINAINYYTPIIPKDCPLLKNKILVKYE